MITSVLTFAVTASSVRIIASESFPSDPVRPCTSRLTRRREHPVFDFVSDICTA